MKKIYIVSVICFSAFLCLQAQQLSWHYQSPGGNGGQDQAFTVTEAIGGGYVLAGRTGPVGVNAGDIYVIKIDASGNFVWSKIYPGNYIDEIRAIVQSPDGGYITTGVTVDFPDTTIGTANLQDMFIMKLDANGDTVWVRHFGGTGSDTGDGLDSTSDGGYIAAGRYGVNGSNNDFYLVKVNANGDSVWTKTYGGSGSDVARSVRHTSDGGFIVGGTTKSFGPNASSGNIWLIKTNSVGDTLWTKVIGTTNEEECYSVKQTSDGGYILTGRTGDNSSNSADIYIEKTDSLGNTQWSKTYGSAYDDLGRDIIQTSDGGYVLTGIKFEPTGFAPMMYILKMDNSGSKQWDTLIGNYNSPNGAKGYCVHETSDGGLIVAGENDLGNGGLDDRAYVVKYTGVVATAVEEPLDLADFLVYPNPVTDWLNIRLDANIKDVYVYNTLGQQVIHSGKTNALNFSSLQPGAYVIIVRNDNSQWKQMVVKQ